MLIYITISWTPVKFPSWQSGNFSGSLALRRRAKVGPPPDPVRPCPTSRLEMGDGLGRLAPLARTSSFGGFPHRSHLYNPWIPMICFGYMAYYGSSWWFQIWHLTRFSMVKNDEKWLHVGISLPHYLPCLVMGGPLFVASSRLAGRSISFCRATRGEAQQDNHWSVAVRICWI